MDVLRRVWLALRPLVRKRAVETELDDELRFHLEMQAEAYLRQGMPADEAHRQAVLLFGGVEAHREACRDARPSRPIDDLARDARYAARRLAKQPGFTLPAVLTLGVGGGVALALFALVNGVLLRPLPFPAPERLVAVRHEAPGFGIAEGGQSDGTFLHYLRHNRVFAAMGAYLENEVTVTEGPDPERVRVALVTPGVFSTLRTGPSLGRGFTAADAAPDAPRVVVLSHGFWARRFGGDSAAIGRTVELNRRPYEVIGVMPAGFGFPRPETQVWYALPVEAARAGVRDLHLQAIARLRAGVSVRAAERDLQRLARTLGSSYPDASAEELDAARFRPIVLPLKEATVGGVRARLTLLLATAAVVLLVATANVTNLFLVRADRQRREVAVERALGAAGRDLTRRYLCESLGVAALGALVALGIAQVAVMLRFGLSAEQLPRLHEVRLDGTAVAALALLSLAGGVLLGVVARVRAGRANVLDALKGGGRSTGGRQWQAAQRLLVAVQVAASLALLVASAQMVQSLRQLHRVPLGFSANRVQTVRLSLPFSPYPTYAASARFYERLTERLRAEPGVDAADAVATLPLTSSPAFLDGAVAPADAARLPSGPVPTASFNLATPGYFSTLDIPVVRGRAFLPGDAASVERPVLVSGALARALFPGTDAVGRRVRLPGLPTYPAYTIVGVVGDVPGATLAGGGARTLFFPVAAEPARGGAAGADIPYLPSDMTVVVRTSLAPSAFVAAVRRAVHELDPKVPLGRVRPMSEVVAGATAATRLTTLLLLAAAGASVLLGVVGVYGVIAYAVGQRTAEIGVRIALGATPAGVQWMVLRQGAAVALAGISAGLVLAYASTRLLRGLLFEVSPGDPLSFASMAALLLVIALAASYLPARRAARTDLLRALRAE